MHGNTVLRVKAGASACVRYGAWIIMSKRLHGRHGWTPAPQFIKKHAAFFYALPVCTHAPRPFFSPRARSARGGAVDNAVLHAPPPPCPR